MKKITIELSDADIEDILGLVHRAIGVVDRLEALVDELEEDGALLEELKGARGIAGIRQ